MPTTLLIEPGRQALLHANGLMEFDDFLRRPAAGPAASSHWNRQTVPIELSDGGQPRRFFLKRLLRAQPEHVLAAALRLKKPMTQPMREWHHIARLRAAGIPVMHRVAAGQRTRLGWPVAAFLLVEAVPCEFTVADWLADDAPRLAPWMRRRLVLELGALARRLDDAGLVWLDLDAKHIYARPHPNSRRGARWEFWLIDVERLADRPPSPHGVAAATAMADMLDPSTSRRDVRLPGRWDFWVYYGAGMGARAVGRARREKPESEFTRFLRGLARHRRWTARFAETPPRRAAAPQDPVALNGMRTAATVSPLLAHAGCHTFDRLFALASGAPLDKAGLQRWRRRDRIALPDGDGREHIFYLKRYSLPPLRAQLRRIFSGHARHSFAAVERDAIDALEAAGIPTPGWAVFGERMIGPVERRSLILLPEVPGQSLERFVADCIHEGKSPSAAIRHDVIRQLAGLVGHMHDSGLCHRDLYLAHVFVDFPTGRPRLCLIDLARIIRRRDLSMRWRIKDLAALDYSSPRPWITRTDRLRFLRHYLRSPRGRLFRDAPPELLVLHPPVRGRRRRILRFVAMPSARYETWIAAVAARNARMARHDRKHGRRATAVHTGERA